MTKFIIAILAFMALGSSAANAAIQTINITGSYEGVTASGIPAGTVIGSFSYDDALDVAGVGPLGAFDLLSFTFALSGGPVVDLTDDPFAQLLTQRSTGDILELDFFAQISSGFGIPNITITSDSGVLAFFIFDENSIVLAEGIYSFEPVGMAVPLPAFGLFVPFAAYGLIRTSKRRRSLV